MKILVVTATQLEWLPIESRLIKDGFVVGKHGIWTAADLEVAPLITGVGMMMTAAHLASQYSMFKPDLSINIGIAGSYRRDIELGSVVQVTREQLGDLGVEQKDGSFTDVFSADLVGGERHPFSGGCLVNPMEKLDFLPVVKGLTVNTVSGYGPHISRLMKNYDADIETMEGAAFFYVSLLHEVKFLSIRAISNYVEPRDRASWKIELALTNLVETVSEILGACIQPV